METVRAPATLDMPKDTVLDMPEDSGTDVPKATVAGRKCRQCHGTNCFGECARDARINEGFGFSSRSVSKAACSRAKAAKVEQEAQDMLNERWACGMVANALLSLDKPDIARQNNFVIVVTLKGSTEAFQVAPRASGAKPGFGTLEEHIQAARHSLNQMKGTYSEESHKRRMAALEKEYCEPASVEAPGGVVADTESGTHSNPVWEELLKTLESQPKRYSVVINDMKLVFQGSSATTSDDDESVSAKDKEKRALHAHHPHRHSYSSAESHGAHSSASYTASYDEYDESTDSEADEPDEVYDIPVPEYGVSSDSAAPAPAPVPMLDPRVYRI